jgi:hypothetical protein
MKANFNKWWLLPSGILIFSALVALGIVAFKPAFIDSSYVQVAQRVGSEPTLTGEAARDCSGDEASDYSCLQEHYQELVRGSGVDAAFTDLKDEYEKNKFVTDNCHQLTHVIGRAAVGLYGDLSNTYGHGDNFCWSGYYHGAMEAIVAKIGPDEVVNEANTICSDLGEHQEHSFYHYNCVHGLGHGFMGIMDDELFKSLETCDTLADSWERESCYGGVFMENVMAKNNPDHPSKYLKDDQPMYPCTDVDTKYKSQCYTMQTSYALQVEGTFNKVFDLCSTVEDDYRTTCYQSLGRDASSQSNSDPSKTKDVCMLGQDYDARSNCVIGAVKDFISYYNSDEQAKELCGSLDADLRDVCLDTGEEFYKTIQT